ncbi:MAG: hypothetical protein V9G13_12180 [Marmoricola sp.]
MKVTDPAGAFDTKQVVITVNANVAPTAAFNATPASGPRPLLVSLGCIRLRLMLTAPSRQLRLGLR